MTQPSTSSGPRIPPLPVTEWDEHLARLLAASPGGTEEPMHIFATLARGGPDLFRRWLGFGGALLDGNLSPRLRELVILRTAHRFDGRYEWAQHVEMAQTAGVTHREMVALGGDLGAAEWSELELAALRAVDDTADAGAVADATWEMLAAHLDDQGLIELLLLIGHYLMLATVLRSLRMELEPRAEAAAGRVKAGPGE